ncbi:MAG: hypothetical protein INH41_21160 [Myxococcaceae bacterium]|jgi:hypothetical protein|nr:hypothetical protein [Myxococcaceae bacterium]MCA3014903.1 hypothetical protein [Myxococcaceae bacterium]
MRRFALAALAVTLAPHAAFPMEKVELTEEEYKMYKHTRLALEDPRVQAMKPEARLPAIAKDAGFKLKELQKAMERGEAAGDVKARCDANLKEALEATELKGKLGRVEVDTDAAHAVIYIQWFNEEAKDLPVQAATAAVAAPAACPIASTITVYAQDKAAPKARVFQALISAQAARRINADKVKDFAETRYVKLFEKVKSVASGDDLSGESAPPTAQP